MLRSDIGTKSWDLWKSISEALVLPIASDWQGPDVTGSFLRWLLKTCSILWRRSERRYWIIVVLVLTAKCVIWVTHLGTVRRWSFSLQSDTMLLWPFSLQSDNMLLWPFSLLLWKTKRVFSTHQIRTIPKQVLDVDRTLSQNKIYQSCFNFLQALAFMKYDSGLCLGLLLEPFSFLALASPWQYE